jgi:hypothetical protein
VKQPWLARERSLIFKHVPKSVNYVDTTNPMTILEDFIDLETPTGLMRTHRYWPAAAGRYPGVGFFSEIYQLTGPIARTARFVAGHGYAVYLQASW